LRHNGIVHMSSAFCDMLEPVTAGEMPMGAQWCGSDGAR
jgi:hypothetical protein